MLVLALSGAFVLSDSQTGKAFADIVSIPPVYAGLPDPLAGAAAVASAEGYVTAFGAAGAAADGLAVGAAAPLVVAGAPVLTAAAAALIIGGAVYLAWHWGTSHNPNYADVPPTTVYNYGGGWAVSWTPLGTSGGCCYGATVTGPSGWPYSVGATTSTGWNGGSAQMTANGSPQQVTANLGQANGVLRSMCVYAPWLSANVATEGVITGPGCGGGNDVAPTSTTTNGTAVPGTGAVTTTPTSQCSNGASTVTVAGTPMHYTGGTASADLPPIIAPACPAGYVRTGLTTPSTGPGGAVLPQLVTWSAPTIPSTYADCQPGGAQAPCVLTLTMTAPGGQTLNCTNTTNCPLYAGASTDAQGDTYTCKWGTYVLPASNCVEVPTKPGTGTPATTGQTDIKTAGTGTSNSDGGDGCGASGGIFGAFSWNPVDWVLKPVMCALRKAFIPSSTTVTQVQAEYSAVTAKPPFSVIAAGLAFVAPFGSLAQTCPDWSVGVAGHSFSVVCGQSFMQKLHDTRAFTGLCLVALAFGPFLWRLWHAVIPFINVSPGNR
jgi:hypothetical protein